MGGGTKGQGAHGRGIFIWVREKNIPQSLDTQSALKPLDVRTWHATYGSNANMRMNA
jgi:hypothetical protein